MASAAPAEMELQIRAESSLGTKSALTLDPRFRLFGCIINTRSGDSMSTSSALLSGDMSPQHQIPGSFMAQLLGDSDSPPHACAMETPETEQNLGSGGSTSQASKKGKRKGARQAQDQKRRRSGAGASCSPRAAGCEDQSSDDAVGNSEEDAAPETSECSDDEDQAARDKAFADGQERGESALGQGTSSSDGCKGSKGSDCSTVEDPGSTAGGTSGSGAKKGGPPNGVVLLKPDKLLPCPRCRSMDTKFCYYNNYNPKQPRHFCKACQRYWTAGGTLRNVPPGSGRRKTKLGGGLPAGPGTPGSTSSAASSALASASVKGHCAESSLLKGPSSAHMSLLGLPMPGSRVAGLGLPMSAMDSLSSLRGGDAAALWGEPASSAGVPRSLSLPLHGGPLPAGALATEADAEQPAAQGGAQDQVLPLNPWQQMIMGMGQGADSAAAAPAVWGGEGEKTAKRMPNISQMAALTSTEAEVAAGDYSRPMRCQTWSHPFSAWPPSPAASPGAWFGGGAAAAAAAAGSPMAAFGGAGNMWGGAPNASPWSYYAAAAAAAAMGWMPPPGADPASSMMGPGMMSAWAAKAGMNMGMPPAAHFPFPPMVGAAWPQAAAAMAVAAAAAAPMPGSAWPIPPPSSTPVAAAAAVAAASGAAAVPMGGEGATVHRPHATGMTGGVKTLDLLERRYNAGQEEGEEGGARPSSGFFLEGMSVGKGEPEKSRGLGMLEHNPAARMRSRAFQES